MVGIGARWENVEIVFHLTNCININTFLLFLRMLDLCIRLTHWTGLLAVSYLTQLQKTERNDSKYDRKSEKSIKYVAREEEISPYGFQSFGKIRPIFA